MRISRPLGDEEQHTPVRMLVGKQRVKSAGAVLGAQAPDFLHLRRVGQARHVEHDGPHVGIRAVLPEVKRLHVVIAAVELEVMAVRSPAAGMQLGLFNGP
jgi:hypothetical protein